MLHIEPAGKRPKPHLMKQDCQKQMMLMRCRAFQRMNQHFLRSGFHSLTNTPMLAGWRGVERTTNSSFSHCRCHFLLTTYSLQRKDVISLLT